jgi:hypothetical protein
LRRRNHAGLNSNSLRRADASQDISGCVDAELRVVCGRGWWDPLSADKGDIFSLAQYLNPSLDFPASCHVLRESGERRRCCEPADS